MSFAQNLEKIMKDNECTKYRLAKWLGVHQTTIKNWLDGKTEPKFETIHQLASIFGVRMTDFFDDPEDNTIHATKEFIQLLDTNLEKITIESKSKIEPTPEEKALDIPIIDFEAACFNKLCCNFNKLNYSGKKEAVKRIEELTEIPKYTTPDSDNNNNDSE